MNSDSNLYRNLKYMKWQHLGFTIPAMRQLSCGDVSMNYHNTPSRGPTTTCIVTIPYAKLGHFFLNVLAGRIP